MTFPRFDRPFPSLTPEDRYHLDAFGYVVVGNTLTLDEVEKLKKAFYPTFSR